MGIGTRIWNALIVLITLVLIRSLILGRSRKLRAWIVRRKRSRSLPHFIRRLGYLEMRATTTNVRKFNRIVRELEDLGYPVGSFSIDLQDTPNDQEFVTQRERLLERLEDVKDRVI